MHVAHLEVFGGLGQAQRVKRTIAWHSAIEPRWSVSTRNPKALACECCANIGREESRDIACHAISSKSKSVGKYYRKNLPEVFLPPPRFCVPGFRDDTGSDFVGAFLRTFLAFWGAFFTCCGAFLICLVLGVAFLACTQQWYCSFGRCDVRTYYEAGCGEDNDHADSCCSLVSKYPLRTCLKSALVVLPLLIVETWVPANEDIIATAYRVMHKAR